MSQSIGVENTQGLLQPGDDSILDPNQLVDNQAQAKQAETTAKELEYIKQLGVESASEISTPEEGESNLEHSIRTSSSGPIYGKNLNDVSYDDYADYIDRPFSFISDDAEDLRAYGQTTGEKWKFALPKFVTKVGANVIGSTAGLVYGGGAFLSGIATPGESAAKNFWDNDFQRGLDGINNWMDDKLPHYYTKEEQEYNFWRSMGTPNFWSNDVANGLSFVTGAVLSEYLSAGLARGQVAMKAKQLFTKSSKHAKAGTSSTVGKQLFKDKVVNPHRLQGGLTTLRQLGTGAMYEAGVESRHHYDATLKNLVELYKEEHNGQEPSKNDMSGLVDIATKSGNAVFAGNVALVGYSNYMMFPKLFGKGFNSSRNSLKNTIKSNLTEKGRAYRELFKNIGQKEVVARNLFRVLKTPLYEGFVEEGGQKLLDLSGQTAGLNYYQAKKDGESVNMLAELIDNFDDRFADVYGSKEGQKEIGIGFILGALGIPTKGKTGKKTAEGKDEKKWQMNGAWASVKRGREYKKAITRLKERLEKDPTVLAAFERNFDSLVRDKVIQDSKDFADVIDSPFMFKNAEGDAIYNYISSRLEAGMEEEIYDNIDMIKSLSKEEFRSTFLYNDKNDLTDTELETRRNEIADALVARTETIKNTRKMVDKSFVNYGSSQKDAIVHAMAVSEDADFREDNIIKTIEAITGVTIENTEYEDKALAGQAEISESKDRQSKVTQRLPAKYKKAEENSPEGQQVKRKLGIKEFTDPTHLEELFSVLAQKKADLQARIDNVHSDESLSPKEKDKRTEELGAELNSVLNRMSYLSKNISNALDPDLSAMEQTYIDNWNSSNPSSYAQHSEDVIQMLKDARKIRARRHRALSMYNELLELKEDLVWNPTLRKPFNFEGGEAIAPPEMMLQRVLSFNKEQGDIKLNDKDLERLYRRHKGTVVEFDIESDGVTKTHRFIVQDTPIESGEDEVLIAVPTLEALTLLRRQEQLKEELASYTKQNLKAEALSSRTRLDVLEKELAALGFGPRLQKEKLSTLLQATHGHIKTITGNDLTSEYLESSLDYAAEELAEGLGVVQEGMDVMQKELEKAVSDLQAFIEANVSSAKDIALAKTAHSNTISKLEKRVSKAKQDLEQYKSRLTRVEDDMKVLHGIREESENAKTEQEVVALMTSIFKRQWGGELSTVLSNIFDSIEDTTLKNLLHTTKPDYSLQQFRDLPVNQDLIDNPKGASILRSRWREYNSQTKSQTLGDLLLSTQDRAIELLASVDTGAKALVDRLAAIEKDIAGLANLYTITEKGLLGVNNKGVPGVRASKKQFKELEIEKAEILNQLNQMSSSLLRAGQETFQTIIDYQALQNEVIGHYTYLRDKMDELRNPSFSEDTVDDEVADSHGAHTDLGTLTKQGEQSGMYLNSSPITVLRMMKTTGAHDQALREYKEMQELLVKKQKVDPIKYAHVESQLRLFKFLPKLYPEVKGTSDFKYDMKKYRFMVANKNIIPKNLQSEITFYDLSSKSFKYASDMQGSILTEDKETIKLILTDVKGKPVLVGGKPIYSDLPGSELTKKVQDANGKEVEVYRYGKLDLKEDTYQEILLKNGKTGITGELTQDAQDIHKDHIKFREDILQLTEPKLIKLKGASFTLLFRPEIKRPPARASRSIVDNKHQVKDIGLRVSLNGKVSVFGKDYKVPKGFPYTNKAGKLVPVRVNKLTGAAYENVLNMFKLLAVRHAQVKNKEMSYKESQILQEGNPKQILHALKDTIYMGKHSFENAPIHKKLNVQGNKIYFGESIIEFHQLLTPESNTEVNKQFLDFLKGLHHQVNYFSLKKDLTSRSDVGKKYNANLVSYEKRKKTAKSKKKAFLEKAPTYPTTSYEPFFEFTVGTDMDVKSTKWDNYTDYLLGDGNTTVDRPLDQIPAYTNLVETSDELDAPQFLNGFVTLERNKSVDQLDDIGVSSAKEAIEEAPTKDLKVFVKPQGPSVNQGPKSEQAPTGVPPAGANISSENRGEYLADLIEDTNSKKGEKTVKLIKDNDGILYTHRTKRTGGNTHRSEKRKKDDC